MRRLSQLHTNARHQARPTNSPPGGRATSWERSSPGCIVKAREGGECRYFTSLGGPMRIFTRPYQLPPRLAAAAIILNSGLDKSGADEQAAAGLHGMAAGTYPFLGRMDPVTFTRLLSRAEITLGTALLLPFVPSLVAGAALTGFAGGLLGLYLKTPGMRREG